MWKSLLLTSFALTQVFAASSLRRLVTYYPYVEPGFDFVDHDLDHVPGTSIDDCKQKCIDYTGPTKCNAYTYSDFGTGTCWLKSTRDQVVVNANTKSAVLWTEDWTAKVCQLRIDLDYVDNDLQHVSNIPKAEDCCDECHKTLGCRAFSWNKDNGGTCWLKSKRDKVIFNPGVVSADAYPTGDVGTSVQFDTDYIDHDIGNKPSSDYNGCFSICTSTPGCHAFSWSNYGTGTCWLKARKELTQGKGGVVSAEVSVAVDDCGWESDGWDYDDHDIGNTVGIVNYKDCCQICKGTTNCKAFAWSNFQGGTCWLKSSKGTLVPKSGVKAGWTM